MIKTLGAKSSETDAQDLDRELSVLQLLHHPRIVRLVGAGQMPQVNTHDTVEYTPTGGRGGHSNQNQLWCVNIGEIHGYWVHSGF